MKKYINNKQGGQIIALTALLIPLFMAAAGLAIDFGNMYVHKSKLQNAADAAAVAAGWAYAEDGRNDKNSLGVAEEEAQYSTKVNLGNGPFDAEVYYDNKNGFIKVQVNEKGIPVYFLRYFGVSDSVDLSAVSYVQVAAGGNVSDWNRLVYYDSVHNKHGAGYDFKAQNKVVFFKDNNGGLVDAGHTITGNNKDVLEPFLRDKEMQGNVEELFGKDVWNKFSNNSPNLKDNITNKPYYLTTSNYEAKEAACNIGQNENKGITTMLLNFYGNSNATPHFLIYTGTAKLVVDLPSGGSFNGVIYAPNAHLEIGTNTKGAAFEYTGMVIGKSVLLEAGTYKFKDYLSGIDNSGGSGSSSGGGSSNSSVSLVSSSQLPDGINFTQ